MLFIIVSHLYYYHYYHYYYIILLSFLYMYSSPYPLPSEYRGGTFTLIHIQIVMNVASYHRYIVFIITSTFAQSSVSYLVHSFNPLFALFLNIKSSPYERQACSLYIAASNRRYLTRNNRSATRPTAVGNENPYHSALESLPPASSTFYTHHPYFPPRRGISLYRNIIGT